MVYLLDSILTKVICLKKIVLVSLENVVKKFTARLLIQLYLLHKYAYLYIIHLLKMVI